jgi:hypothetical protein
MLGGALGTQRGEEKCMQGFYEETSSGDRYHLEDLGVDGKVILKWMLKKKIKNWIVLIWPRIGTDGRLF